MKSNIVLKTITLLCFISLVSCFVLYQMGKFDSMLFNDEASFQGSSNGGSLSPFKNYSLQTPKLNERPTDSIFRLLLTDNQLNYWDFVKKKQFQFITAPPLVTMMSSSKSSQIFTYEKIKFLHVDFIMDTIKRKKKK